MNEVKLKYALKGDKIVSINDIPDDERGLKCNCVCPLCNEKLSAKLGSKNQHHFAHNSNSNCNLTSATETALHRLAKEIIEDEKTILLPSYFINFIDTNVYKSLDEKSKIRFEHLFTEPYEIIKPQYVKFDSVILEKALDSIVPDVIGITNNKKCLVEIAVFHFANDKKKAKIEDLQLPTIEINLKCLTKAPLSKNELKNKIINDVDCKKWIFNPKIHLKAIEADLHFENEINKIIKNSDKKHTEIAKTYPEKITIKRNDSSFFEYYKKTDLYKESLVLPFFLDIPIEGENYINYDRRIWQSFVFEFLKLTQNQYKCIKYLDVEDFVLDQLSFQTSNYSIDVTKVINTFLLHLHHLGFIKYDCYSLSNTDNYIHINIPNNSFSPPNEEYAIELHNIVKNSDSCSLEAAEKTNNLLFKKHFKK